MKIDSGGHRRTLKCNVVVNNLRWERLLYNSLKMTLHSSIYYKNESKYKGGSINVLRYLQ